MKKLSALTVLSIIFLLSCSNGGESTASEEAVADCKTENLSFSADIWPIFDSNCMGCHNEEDYARKADGNKMTNYVEIKEKLDEGLIIGNIEHASGFINMPYKKKKITDCEIAMIKAWVAEGAENN